MEPEGSLPHSQKPATCRCPEPDQSSPFPPSHFLKIHLIIILPIYAVVVKGKAIPLQALTGPEGSRRLKLPDFKTIGT
jgi:hypothetical protein